MCMKDLLSGPVLESQDKGDGSLLVGLCKPTIKTLKLVYGKWKIHDVCYKLLDIKFDALVT